LPSARFSNESYHNINPRKERPFIKNDKNEGFWLKKTALYFRQSCHWFFAPIGKEIKRAGRFLALPSLSDD
jgi:hypothetical protein